MDEWIAPAVGSGWIPVVRRYAHQWQGSADSRRYRGQGLSVAPGTPIKDLVSVGLGGSTFPSSLAQAVEHVGVIFQPVPGHALADIHLERRRRDAGHPVIAPVEVVRLSLVAWITEIGSR